MTKQTLSRRHLNKMWEHHQSMTAKELRKNIVNQLDNIDIDIRIKPIVIALNKVGYLTTDCCAGHIDDISLGHISFLDRLNTRRLNSVFQKLGFQEVHAISGAVNYGCSVWFRPYTTPIDLDSLIETLIYPNSIKIVSKTDDNITLHFSRKSHAWIQD